MERRTEPTQQVPKRVQSPSHDSTSATPASERLSVLIGGDQSSDRICQLMETLIRFYDFLVILIWMSVALVAGDAVLRGSKIETFSSRILFCFRLVHPIPPLSRNQLRRRYQTKPCPFPRPSQSSRGLSNNLYHRPPTIYPSSTTVFGRAAVVNEWLFGSVAPVAFH